LVPVAAWYGAGNKWSILYRRAPDIAPSLDILARDDVGTEILESKRQSVARRVLLSRIVAMNLAKDALWAVLAGAWIAGLVHQFGSWPITALYVAISVAMVAGMFSRHLVHKFAPRRNRRQ